MSQNKAGIVSVPKISDPKTYELMFILEPGKQEKDRTELLSKIRKHLGDTGASIKFEDLTWGERMMMYPMNGHDYGYYGVFVFSALPKDIKNIDESIRLEVGVVRILITEVPKNYKMVKFADIKDHYDIVPNSNASKIKVVPKKKAITEQNLEEILSQEI